jgi:hypothetical protein
VKIFPGSYPEMDLWLFLALCGYLAFETAFLAHYLITSDSRKSGTVIPELKNRRRAGHNPSPAT